MATGHAILEDVFFVPCALPATPPLEILHITWTKPRKPMNSHSLIWGSVGSLEGVNHHKKGTSLMLEPLDQEAFLRLAARRKGSRRAVRLLRVRRHVQGGF